VLVVEDDPGIATQLVRGLERAGYTADSVSLGAEALRRPPFDVVLLDLGLPDLDGIDVCRRLRADSDTAIIVVTARGEEADRVLALDEGADEIAGRSRGTPRIANRLLRRVRDYAEVRADGVVNRAVARAALELYEVDDNGLDRLDRAVLSALVRRFAGGPVGLSTLAVAVGEEAETVEVVVEPFLVRLGLMARTPRGRVATPGAWEQFGLLPPAPDPAGPVTLFG